LSGRSCRACLLDFLQARLVSLQSGLDRLEQRLELLLILFAGMAEPLLGLLEEAIVRAVHCLGCKLAEARLELPLKLLQLRKLLLMRLRPLGFAALEPGLGGSERLLFGAQFGELAILLDDAVGHRAEPIGFGAGG
jgi:hypothetical protein